MKLSLISASVLAYVLLGATWLCQAEVALR
jgi:hypothetical protein